MTTAGPRSTSRLQVLVSGFTPTPVRVPGLGDWLAGAAPRSARGVVHIALVTDAAIRKLNRTFRAADCATDVLSFPADAPPLLGDIAIAAGVAARQARRARHSLTTEVRVLALHGLLHLLGYDHEADAGQMARVEVRLRRRSGLPLGLIERSSASKPAAVRRRR